MSEVFLAFVRRRGCTFCDQPAPSAPHHYPPKGRGVTRDDRTIAVCIRCHRRCHGEMVDGQPPIPESAQVAAVHETRSAFMDRASETEWQQFTRDRQRWIESRGGIPL